MEVIKSFYIKIIKFLELVSNIIRDNIKKHYDVILMVVTFILFMVSIIGMMDVVTNDIRSFIVHWYRNFYENGSSALGESIGDYTPAYMYFLWFISLFKVVPPDFTSQSYDLTFLYLVKGYSLIYQLITSVFIVLIIKHLTNNKLAYSIGFALSLFAPTLMLNSGFWGQCDAIYTCFIVIALYYLLKEKPFLATIFVSLAFCYKLQSIFFVPVLLLLFLNKKYKLSYLFLIPIIYILAGVPSMLCGRTFISIMGVFVNQVGGSYRELTLNCATLWAIIFRNFMSNEYLELYSIMLAIVTTGIFIVAIFVKEINLNNKSNLVKVAYLFSLVMPFVMPHMHERYYYLADILAIIYIVLNKEKFYIGIMTLLVSLSGYCRYLWSFDIFYGGNNNASAEMNFRIGAFIMLIAISLLVIDLFKNNVNKVKRNEKKLLESE